MRYYLLVIVILLLSILLIPGCSNKTIKETEGKENEYTQPMVGLVSINGIDYQMEEGNYRWEIKKGLETVVIQTDHASPYQMADHIKSIILKPSEKVNIKLKENPNIKVYLWNDEGRGSEITQNANQITVPAKKKVSISMKS